MQRSNSFIMSCGILSKILCCVVGAAASGALHGRLRGRRGVQAHHVGLDLGRRPPEHPNFIVVRVD